jgi:uncharacterized protein YecT (DUF1311 family)
MIVSDRLLIHAQRAWIGFNQIDQTRHHLIDANL